MPYSLPRIDLAVGVIDGHNTTFFTPIAPYEATTLRLYLNGQLRPNEDIVEIDPVHGEFLIVEPDAVPRPGDILQIFYLDGRPTNLISLTGQIQHIRGKIYPVNQLQGSVFTVQLAASIIPSTMMRGALIDKTVLRGTVQEAFTVRGQIKACKPC